MAILMPLAVYANILVEGRGGLSMGVTYPAGWDEGTKVRRYIDTYFGVRTEERDLEEAEGKEVSIDESGVQERKFRQSGALTALCGWVAVGIPDLCLYGFDLAKYILDRRTLHSARDSEKWTNSFACRRPVGLPPPPASDVTKSRFSGKRATQVPKQAVSRGTYGQCQS